MDTYPLDILTVRRKQIPVDQLTTALYFRQGYRIFGNAESLASEAVSSLVSNWVDAEHGLMDDEPGDISRKVQGFYGLDGFSANHCLEYHRLVFSISDTIDYAHHRA